MSIQTISPTQLDARRQRGESVDLIDVRTPMEFREVHAAAARNVPLDSMDPRHVMQQRNGSGHDPLYVICRSGGRATKACERFTTAGYTNVFQVEGGTDAWDQAGLPVVRGKKAISLERQVRIAAGLLVLVGVALSLFIHPVFLALSAFVGAGLMFAGIADWCGMAMLLAKMPWNQVKCDSGINSAK